jgi:2-methylisocitrate lyase-like PEP mutase family enzyme
MTGISPRMSREELAELGIVVSILPGAILHASIMMMYDYAVALREKGPLAESEMASAYRGHPLANLHEFSGFDQIRALEEKFLPEESARKYEGTLGHMPRSATG